MERSSPEEGLAFSPSRGVEVYKGQARAPWSPVGLPLILQTERCHPLCEECV